MCNTVKSEQAADYKAEAPQPLHPGEQSIIDRALHVIRTKLNTPGMALTSPALVRDYLILRLAQLKKEHFALILLNNQNQVIGFEDIARGTIDSASVYPREVVKTVLDHNAAAVILAHNHPSGDPEPSQADILLTRRLKEALALVDVRVLDHIIVGGCSQTRTVSFAERGLI